MLCDASIKKLCFQEWLQGQGKCTAIWSPSKSALNAVQARGCSWIAFPSIILGWKAWIPKRCKRWSTVKQNRVSLHHVFQDIPYYGSLACRRSSSQTSPFSRSTLDHLADDERLVELGCHVFGKTTFVQLQVRTNDDDRTCRVVHTLTEEVLTETTLLALQAVDSDFSGRLLSVFTATTCGSCQTSCLPPPATCASRCARITSGP